MVSLADKLRRKGLELNRADLIECADELDAAMDGAFTDRFHVAIGKWNSTFNNACEKWKEVTGEEL